MCSANVNKIGSSAFFFWQFLKKIQEPFEIEEDTFKRFADFVDEETTIYVPKGTKEKYKANSDRGDVRIFSY